MKKKTTPLFAAAITLLFIATGCTSISRSDRVMLRQIEAYGLGKSDEKVKAPAMAGALNLLPGFGNFYLATGTDQSGQWLVGAINILFWPISPIWGIPQAAIDANTINKLETVYYYQFDPRGKREFSNAQNNTTATPGGFF